jgi:hypothetical protein
MTSSAVLPQESRAPIWLPIAPLAVLLSCVFSVIVILQNPLLNDDAYKYLRAVDLYTASGAQAVLETYGWFYYSIVIALLDPILPGGPLLAAQLLNTALYALLTWVFIRLVRELRDSLRVQFFAALCILMFPLANEMRYFLMRDAGFWAFALLSVIFLVQYRATGLLRKALWWCLALCAATVFRLEALLLLALTPFSLLLPGSGLATGERFLRFARLVGILAVVVASVLLLAYAAGFNLIELIAFAYRYYLPALADLIPGVVTTGAGAGAVMFTPDNFPGAAGTLPGLAAVLFGDLLALLMNLVNALSVPATVFILYYRARYSPLLLPAAGSRVLLTYIGASLLALLLFVLIMHFLTQRYAALLALLFLIMVPLMLDDVLARMQQRGTAARFRYVLGFFCFYYVVDSLLSFGYSQQHIDQGIAWTLSKELPSAAPVRTNNFAIAYHSGRVADYDLTVRDAALVVADSAPGEYVILEIDHDAPTDTLDADAGLEEVTRFSNERGDTVRIYRRR